MEGAPPLAASPLAASLSTTAFFPALAAGEQARRRAARQSGTRPLFNFPIVPSSIAQRPLSLHLEGISAKPRDYANDAIDLHGSSASGYARND
jgi:hypothetical protein